MSDAAIGFVLFIAIAAFVWWCAAPVLRALEERRQLAQLRSGYYLPPGRAAYFWVRYDPPPEGAQRPRPRFSGLTIGERPRLFARIRTALRRLMRRLR